MRGVVGLRGQVSALPLIAAGNGGAWGLLPVVGVPSPKSLTLIATPANINATGENGTLNSGVVTIAENVTRRGEAFRHQWRQMSGPPGVVVPHVSGGVFFQHSGLPHDAASSLVWRCTVANNFGQGGHIDVSFTLTTYTPIPALSGSASPSSRTLVTIEPASRIARVYFSASGLAGVPPYEYNWGGGYEPNSASNYADVYLAVNATQGIDMAPRCIITDAIGQTKAVDAGPFFIYEG